MLQKMLHGLQGPGYVVDQQKKAAYFPSPVVASGCMKRRARTTKYYVRTN